MIKDNKEQIARIQQMEQHLDQASTAIKQFSVALEKYMSVQKAIVALKEYYGSDEWKQDFADDEAGLLPTELKRGVLSEDGIWNLLSDYDELNNELQEAINVILQQNDKQATKDIYLAGGCFWGTEHYFKQIEGVVETEVGYANGIIDNPTYEQVCTDKTRFAETVHIKYTPNVVSLKFLLQMYFKAIDPISINQQGHDKGSQYRTGIYYTDASDLIIINKIYEDEQKNYQQPLAVEKQPLDNFYPAEEYHQDYLDKNPDGYCHLPLSLFEFARKAKDKHQ